MRLESSAVADPTAHPVLRSLARLQGLLESVLEGPGDSRSEWRARREEITANLARHLKGALTEAGRLLELQLSEFAGTHNST